MNHNYYNTPRYEVAQYLPSSPQKVLEIGCGAGAFRSHLPKNAEVWGIEPVNNVAVRAIPLFDKVLVGMYEHVNRKLPDAYFDLVICNDVIEHMVDHDAFLESIKRKMTPDGYLLGSVPNIRHISSLAKLLIRKDWQYKDSGILDRTHLRFFTELSLRNTFKRHQFDVKLITGISSSLKFGVSAAAGKPLGKFFNLLVRLAILATILITLGYYRDIRFPQFAFLIKK